MKVYCIENIKNSKKYVGITKGKIENRFKQHILKAKNGQKQHLHDAFNLYGIDSFIIYEIDSAVSISDLYEKERYWIQKLNTKNTGYNKTDGGEGSHGRNISEETKQKIREKAKIRFSNPENRKKTSEATKGGMKKWWNSLSDYEKLQWNENCHRRPEGYNYPSIPHTEETKQKMSLSHKGKQFTESHKRNMSNSFRGDKRRGKSGLLNNMKNPESVSKIRQKALGRKKTLRPDGSWYWTKPSCQ